MPVDPSVIAALTVALDTDSENLALRLHLVRLLLEAERYPEALEHSAFVLSRQPDNTEALTYAARAAEEAGQSSRADSYRRLLRALRGDGATAPEPPTPLTSTPAPARLRTDGWDEAPEPIFSAEESTIRLSDVAGMEAVKRRLNIAFLAPLKNPELRAMYGKSLRGGMLLYGPPGCGKTYLARAVAGELGAQFISIGLADVLDMYVGESEKNIRALFAEARRRRPCVLFFDEMDALGRKRSLRRESATRDTLNQLLSELDGVGSDNEGIFVLAATNHPWDIDAALRRPGRLDRTLLVLPPDAPAREAILRLQCAQRPVGTLDYAALSARTDDFSGADLVHLVETAAEYALEDSVVRGTVRPIGNDDFKKALREVHPSPRPWLDMARNYALFANEGGIYDELVEYLRAKKLL
ncbi:ATP-binding protein [Armatimonas rosea]|uniref:SpoVK/Ycf46/Vps4 family AAA+-type ATPase n=1 Tax=Armatimonas rosea TaxID=685828 RepID=A0A7W9W6G5_ARMRO|nr:ATP-binding protein [Armatimonas rosea]MBB6050146.1 SpoVK/Ycf46/Vps4 family AAA+-type ATPase [Armatimonas rosea]